jgi:hypothetical protein
MVEDMGLSVRIVFNQKSLREAVIRKVVVAFLVVSG